MSMLYIGPGSGRAPVDLWLVVEALLAVLAMVPAAVLLACLLQAVIGAVQGAASMARPSYAPWFPIGTLIHARPPPSRPLGREPREAARKLP